MPTSCPGSRSSRSTGCSAASPASTTCSSASAEPTTNGHTRLVGQRGWVDPVEGAAGKAYRLAGRADWLLVFHDAPAPAAVEGLHLKRRRTVLVTTRDVGSRSTASLIDINPLLPPDAEQLLRDETGRDEPELSLLARELWNVPVLMQAAPARSRASSAVAVLSVRQLTA